MIMLDWSGRNETFDLNAPTHFDEEFSGQHFLIRIPERAKPICSPENNMLIFHDRTTK
jgi:hypothetical protein